MTGNPNDDIVRRARRSGTTPAAEGRRSLADWIARRRAEKPEPPQLCRWCREPLIDDDGASWPYCPLCGWAETDEL